MPARSRAGRAILLAVLRRLRGACELRTGVRGVSEATSAAVTLRTALSQAAALARTDHAVRDRSRRGRGWPDRSTGHRGRTPLDSCAIRWRSMRRAKCSWPVRKAKSEQKVSLMTPVRRVVVHDTAERLGVAPRRGGSAGSRQDRQARDGGRRRAAGRGRARRGGGPRASPAAARHGMLDAHVTETVSASPRPCASGCSSRSAPC